MKNMRVAEKRDCYGSLFPLEFRARTCLATILWILVCVVTGTSAAQHPSPKNVLFVFSTVKYGGETLNAIEPYIRAHVSGPVNFYYAYLDDPQSIENSYWEAFAESLRRKYAGIKLDVVIADVTPSLLFAVKYRDRIFSGVPIVFLAVNQRELEGQKIWPGVTGVTNPLGFRETIDLVLRLQPETKAIAVVAGMTSWDSYWLAVLRAELTHYQDRLKEIDLVGIPNREMLNRVSALPPHTVVVFQTSPQYSDDPNFGAWDLVTEIAKRLPTYSVWPRFCVNGCIGGAFEDPIGEWRSTADLATRVLSGQRPEDLPIVHSTDLRVRVDWGALRRWNISEAKLPPGSVTLNREPTLWEHVRKYAFAAIVVIVAQALWIFALLWQRARKRRAEAMLRESEGRFRLVANNAPVLIWMSGEDKLCTYFNEAWLEFTGRPFEAEYGNGWVNGVHPDDLQRCLETYTRCFDRRNSFRMEYRLRRHDGVFRWIMDLGVPRFNADGSFAGFIGSAIDVTEQKLAHEALQRVSGQLIEAQEKERRRISRELHDDICQKLALLSVDLQQARGGLNGSSPETKQQLEEMYKHCSGIALDVQSLSHQLHSSKLDYLGLTAGLTGFCRELAKKHELNIDFEDHNVPSDLPTDISLCLFRVAQEALHNAVKYSGTKQFEVQLSGTAGQVQLVVSDAGAGFDVEEAKKDRGLGLLSMQERVNLVRGRFHIESRLGEGTRVIAAVPLVPYSDQESADSGSKNNTTATDAA